MSSRTFGAMNARERTRFAAFESDGEPRPRDPAPAHRYDDPPPPEPVETASSGPGWLGWLIAAAWTGIAGGAPLAYWGAGPLLAQHPAFITALVAIILFPAAALLFGATAARDAAAARAALANTAHAAPTINVEAERAAWRETIQAAQNSARQLTDLLAQQRAESAAGLEHMKSEMEQMAGAVSRQIRLMREASRLVAQEAASAEAVFAEGLSAFSGVSAEADRATAALRETKDQAQEAQSLLHETIEAASEAAGAVRDASRGAITDARRAAQMIREEAEAARATMQDALAALQRNAAEAREAAELSWTQSAARTPRPEMRAEVRAEVRPEPRPVRMAPAAQERFSLHASTESDLHLDWMSPRRHDGVMLLERLGVSPRTVIADAQMAQIARRARLGATARRRAVAEVAAGALHRLTDAIARSDETHHAARAFLRAPGFDADGPVDTWTGSPDLTRAYLLVDAALG